MNTLHELKAGVDILADAVSVTMGPKGRNVVIHKPEQELKVTKDGVTVAEAISDLENPLHEIGAKMVKEVASRAGNLAGDGTTTATVLAQAMIAEGVKNIAAGANPINIKRGMDKAVAEVIGNLKDMSTNIELGGSELRQVATISANNDNELGELLADAFEAVGSAGVVSVEDSRSHKTYVDVVTGMQFDRGYISPLSTTNPTGTTCELENPMYFLYDGKITSMDKIVIVMGLAKRLGRPLVVIAEDINGTALVQLNVNIVHNALSSVAIKAPGFSETRGDLLLDIGIVTNSVVFSDEGQLTLDHITEDSIEEMMFGGSEGITVENTSTVIVNGNGEASKIVARASVIEKMIEEADSDHERKQLNSRVAKLTGGVGVLYVGANSPVEAKEKRDRADDALCAVRAAIEEGVVPGGGLALLNASKSLVPGTVGADIIIEACQRPMKVIAENSGTNGDVIVAEVNRSEDGIGYNAKTGEYVYLYSEGIIDPTKVTRVALESAVSAAGMVILTECAIY